MSPLHHGNEHDQHEPTQERNHPVSTPTPTPPGGLVEQIAEQVRRRRAAVVLRTAADRIERCGLFKGEYWPVDPDRDRVEYIEGDPCCTLGALAVSTGIADPRTADVELGVRPELHIAGAALTKAIDPDGGSWPWAVVPLWNDDPVREPGEVIATMRAAATGLDRPDIGPPGPNPLDPLTVAGSGGPSAKTFHQASGAEMTSPNHQVDSKETGHV